MDRFGWLFSLTHFATNTSSTTQPHKIPANNLRNAIFTMLVLAWVLSCFPTCWKRHIQQIMLAKVVPRSVGTVKLVCFLCELTHFATNISSTTQPHKIPANNLRNAIFTMFVLAWVLSCFPTCWKIHIQQIMLAKVFPRLVGTVKLVCFLCELWWWKVQLEYG